MTKQWDKYREIIIAEYKENNKPLHEVQRFMQERFGFRASTRAYRSRFDRWGIHKYSRRRRQRSTSPGKREPAPGEEVMRPSPQQSPDVEERGSPAASPAAATPNELLSPGLCGPTSGAGFRSPFCPAQRGQALPSANPIAGHSPAFSWDQLGIRLDPFRARALGSGCYPPSAMPVYRQKPERVVIVGPNSSSVDQGGNSSMQAACGYALGLLADSSRTELTQ